MSDFTFCTVQYDSGDWDSAPLVPANLIDSVARYTSISVAPTGVTVPLGSNELFKYPLAYLTGHLPVRFSDLERRTLREYCARGGMLFVDDHNHDVDGVFHKSALEEIARAVGPLKELPNTHALYSSFFKFDDGPPATTHELNGWGDNLVHKHLLAVHARRPHRRAVQQQGLQLRVGLPSRQQALPLGGQHEVRREHRGVCAHALNGRPPWNTGRPTSWRLRVPLNVPCAPRRSR